MDSLKNLFLYNSDIELAIIICALTLMFLFGIKKKQNDSGSHHLDKNTSFALKGLACIMILLGHYAGMAINSSADTPKTFGWYMYMTSANIALVWFMFISGYGLTISQNIIVNHSTTCLKRIAKVFLPMLYVFFISMLLYAFLPYPFTQEQANNFSIPEEIGMIPSNMAGNWKFILLGIVRWYWYPWCAIAMYICYYLSQYLSAKFKWNNTWTLLGTLTIYYFFAFYCFGPHFAHYYRLVWAFFFGHLFVRWTQLPRWQATLMLFITMLSTCHEGAYMIFSFFIAVAVIFLIVYLNKHYTINGKYFLFLGGISYFYYLCHRRIVWPVLCMVNCHDVIVWTISTIPVAYLSLITYHYLRGVFSRFYEQK